MSRSIDPDNFFQTSDSIAERERKSSKARSNKSGRPIKLGSKVLAVLADPSDGDRVFVGLSAGVVKIVKLSTSTISKTYHPPSSPSSSYSSAASAPITSLALLPTSSSGPATLFAGSWTSHIYAFDVSTGALTRTLSNGHSDFVKCLALAPLSSGRDHQPILASGAADAKVILWNALTGERLHVLSGHVRGVLALAWDPFPSLDLGESAALWSASSDSEIKRWSIGLSARNLAGKEASATSQKERELPLTEEASSKTVVVHETSFAAPFAPHETSVYAVAFSREEGDMWTASADGKACGLARPEPAEAVPMTVPETEHACTRQQQQQQPWQADTTLEHGAANPLRALALSADNRHVFTGGRDEDVWVWDVAEAELKGKFVGHADEVYALVVMGGKVVSGSLDGTVRVWMMEDLEGRRSENDGGDGKGGREAEDENEDEGDGKTEGERKEGSKLTAEEEAELAELMEDDD